MRQSFKIAYGGIVCALSLAMMFMTGIFPFAEYALPAIAGTFLVALVIELGYRTSVIAYIAISLLSALIVPNKEAVVMFIVFLGYYPILKGRLEQIKKRSLEWVMKLLLFNIAIVFAYYLVIQVLGMTEVLEEFNFMKYGLGVIWALGNSTFVIYDIALTRVISMFIQRIRPKIMKRLQ